MLRRLLGRAPLWPAAPLGAMRTNSTVADAADELELVHATATFRHGARCPVFGLDSDVVRRAQWDSCAETARLGARVDAGADAVVALTARSGAMRPSAVDAQQRSHALAGGARSGELTRVGWAQAQALGARLRARYGVANFEELRPRLACRTTHVSRCVLTLRGVLLGLGFAEGTAPVVVETAHASRETLTPSTKRCPRLTRHWARCRAALRSTRRHVDTSPPAFRRLVAKVPADARATFGFPATAVPLKDALIALDSLAAEELPWGVTQDELGALDDAAAAEVALLLGVGSGDGGADEAEALRLAAGPLCRDVLAGLDAAVAAPASKPTLTLLSGHDTTVKPLLVALGVYDHKWPPFCACVVVEVLRRRRDDQLVCRVLYDGATSPAPAAAPEGPFYVVLEETYEAFRGRLAAVALDADAWGELCGGALEGGVEGGGDTFGP